MVGDQILASVETRQACIAVAAQATLDTGESAAGVRATQTSPHFHLLFLLLLLLLLLVRPHLLSNWLEHTWTSS